MYEDQQRLLPINTQSLQDFYQSEKFRKVRRKVRTEKKVKIRSMRDSRFEIYNIPAVFDTSTSSVAMNTRSQ